MRTVSRCRPKTPEASLMLMPSTMHARRTRRYSSTRYIHHTFQGVGLSPMEGGGRSSFQPPSTGDRAAHQVHYCSAVYTRIRVAVSALRGRGEKEWHWHWTEGVSTTHAYAVRSGTDRLCRPPHDIHRVYRVVPNVNLFQSNLDSHRGSDWIGGRFATIGVVPRCRLHESY